MSYANQLVQKGALVRRAFDGYPEHSSVHIDSVGAASPTVAYRARAKLAWDEGGSLGLFARDSHQVVDIPECRVLAEPLLRVAAAARRHLPREGPALDGLDLRLVDRGVLVTLIARRGTPLRALERAARTLCAASSDVIGVAASFRDADTATVLGSGHTILSGNAVEPHHLRAGGPYHLAAHGAFTQAHLGQAEQAHRAIERALRDLGAREVLELYAGSAALSLALAAAGFELTAVETFGPALAEAERAAREQGLPLRTVSGRAEHATRDFADQGKRFDAVIVNPPRRGLSLAVRRALARLDPAAVLYMSCSAPTLARDLAHFHELGFATGRVWPFDMIPHSEAVECLVVARRGPLPPLRIVHEDGELIAVNKSGYDESTLERVRALPGASSAVPVSAVDDECSGLALFARSHAVLPMLQGALAAGGLTFTLLARGVTHKKGRIRRPLRDRQRGAPPCTTYQRVAVHGGHSLISARLDVPSAGPLRQHFASIGHAVLGDAQHGDSASNGFFEHRHGLDRSFLHCSVARLALSSGLLTLQAPLPGELSSVLESTSDQAAPLR